MPGRLVKLLVGLWVFGTGEAAIVQADLGNSPWTVFAQGAANHTPLTIGSATVVTSFVVLLMLYLTARLGPGPRDGLMTGLSRRTGHSLRLWRTVIEVSALAIG